MKLRVADKIHYDAGPNMTPLVDIVMVILIFLMLCGSFVGTEHFLVSNLPISQSGLGKQAPPPGYIPDEPIEIRVDAQAPHAFVATAGKIQTSDPLALTEQLKKMRLALIRAGKSDDQMQVKIGPGKNVKYEQLVRVYEAALNAGYKKVAFARSH
ncbi:MAG TPA: biopolymer transporter ExbD [Tepidisphaeraceae bacterium]|jgi:biopolymer transport protein ExbD